MKKTWVVYKHTNKINGKCYIGITCNKWAKCRWGYNGNGYNQSGQKKFWSAIVKYGWNNFDHEIIESGIQTPEEANEREKYWIAFYDSFKNGYNATTGGSGATGHILTEEKRKEMGRANIGTKHHTQKHTEESRKKMSKRQKGKRHSPKTEFKKGEHRGKEFQKGLIPWNLGKELPPSWNKGLIGSLCHASKAVIQYDMNGDFIKEWGSTTEVQRELGFSSSSIACCCRGEYKQSNGYIWKYKK